MRVCDVMVVVVSQAEHVENAHGHLVAEKARLYIHKQNAKFNKLNSSRQKRRIQTALAGKALQKT